MGKPYSLSDACYNEVKIGNPWWTATAKGFADCVGADAGYAGGEVILFACGTRSVK